LLYSYACAWQGVRIDQPGRWTTHDVTVNLSKVGVSRGRIPGLSRRPVEFALYYSSGAGSLDIDNIRLIDPSGRNLITNGSFDQGPARWFFAVDSHLQWHEKNLWVHLLLEQGWVGVISFSLLVVVALLSLFRRATQGDWLAALPFGGLIGFLSVGLFGTLLDAPRLVLLCFLLVLVGITDRVNWGLAVKQPR